jgi:NET1-associated nuclear protein 1 (U3 small nucleolar RNA-associated protein 17)
VPLKLLNVVWLPSTQTENDYSFVGITDTWGVIVLGDRVDGPTFLAKEISSGSGVGERRSLFQDVFGKSAFTDLSNLSLSPSEPAVSSAKKGKEVGGIFDGPAYLMPPLSTLFEPLIGSFLTLRPAEVQVVEAEDVEMDIDGEDEGLLLSAPEADGIVSKDDMKSLVALFKKHTLEGIFIFTSLVPTLISRQRHCDLLQLRHSK